MGYVELDREAGEIVSLPRLNPPSREPGQLAIPLADDAILGYGAPPASAELRGARLSHGLSVDDASECYRIPAEHIDAMERADLSGLPGKAYLDGFIRSYAKQVEAEMIFGHDPDWYVIELKKEYARSPYYRPRSQYLEREPETRVRAGVVRAVLAFGCVALVALASFGAWYAYEAVQHVEVIDPQFGGRAVGATSGLTSTRS